jgi:hypothetical protein
MPDQPVQYKDVKNMLEPRPATKVETENGGHDSKFKVTIWDKIKMGVMTPVSIYCAIYIFYGIGTGKAPMSASVVVQIILFLFVVWLLGMLEGLQIALLEIEAAKLENVRYFVPGVYTCHKLTQGEGMRRWLGGRQVFVILSVFLLAQLTTFIDMDDFPFTSTPMPDWFKIMFVETGLPGALVVVAIGQLVPQLISATHPLTMMRVPGAEGIVRIAMLLQSLGVTHFAWAVTHFFRWRNYSFNKRALEGDATPEVETGLRRRVNGSTEWVRPDTSACEMVKYVVMTLASLFSLFIIIAGVAQGESRFPAPPYVNFILMVVSITCLVVTFC